MLLQAERPIMICGAGVHRSKAYEEVQAMAELLGLPVATSYMGKSAIRETHDLSVGTMGVIGQKIANDVIGDADVILAVGTCLAPDNTKMLSSRFINPEKQKIIQIDIEALNAGWAYPVTLGIESDAKLALKEIMDQIHEKPIARDVQKRISELKKKKAEASFFSDPAFVSNEIPIAPERVVSELNHLVGDDDQIVLDAGNNRMWMAHHFKSKKAGQIIAAGGAAGVGYGPGAALGAQLVLRGKRVICVCGDGGMMMHLYVMEMAKQYNLPVTYVVMNNACLGNVMDFQAPERQIASKYPRANFAKIAQGFGIEGIRVEDPADLRPAISKALGLDEPVVVDVATADYPHFKMRP
jgi:acetolactate synthase-1/2/3 large subunit